ncbi:MAG: DUF1552 domain-containing protein [Lentisphaerales bacterium]|nr:DUF1552 domain-containing protein [Lentisphaerales bacterium]
MNRRDILRISAMSLALPGTYAASVKNSPRVKQKKNLILVAHDLGLYAPSFQEGGAQSKYMSKVFPDFKGEMTYFDGIAQPTVVGGHPAQKSCFTAFLYETRHMYPDKAMYSIDQVLADRSIQETRHRQVNHKVTAGNNLSWNKFSQPMPALEGADELYTRLFARKEKDADQKEELAIKRQRSILTGLYRNLKRQMRGLPQEKDLKASLEYKLDELDVQEKWLKTQKPYLKQEFQSALVEKAPLLNCDHNYKLILDAIKEGQTKIALIEFGQKTLHKGVPGLTKNQHSYSHHGFYSERIEALETLDFHILRGLQKLLIQLKENDLYDDTIVLFHSGMACAYAHSNKHTPAFLFGGGFKHKESIQCLGKEGDQKYTREMLFSSILKQSGMKDYSFNGNTQLIPELFET